MAVELQQIKAIPTLMRWRAEVLRHVFDQEPSRRLLVENRRYFREHVADGSHEAYVASVDGEQCGCGAVCFYDELPSPDNPTGRCAYLMNIYVREPFRNRGIAHQIVRQLIGEANNRGCGKIYLETTPGARHVYRSIGFDDFSGFMTLVPPK